MSYVKVDEIRSSVESIFKATIIAVQRAVEVAEEASKQQIILTEKPTSFAIHEMETGKLSYKVIK
ncbi:MAG: DNA-directed RNA polymerase subunit omega [Candidatus Saelkia tenebricola]|nr:DNA-directed RNA polymerase subunit omega [Candidatus Saelkia tenebricola]